MQQKSLGLIEVGGLVAAIEAADAAVKAADVELIGYEAANGMGWQTVKLMGDVSAVEAAIQAAEAAASRIGQVISTCVIARMGDGLPAIVGSGDTHKQGKTKEKRARLAEESKTPIKKPEAAAEKPAEKEPGKAEKTAARAQKKPAAQKAKAQPSPEPGAPPKAAGAAEKRKTAAKAKESTPKAEPFDKSAAHPETPAQPADTSAKEKPVTEATTAEQAVSKGEPPAGELNTAIAVVKPVEA